MNVMPIVLNEGEDLQVRTSPGGPLELRLGGDLVTEEGKKNLTAWVADVKKTLAQLKAESGGDIYIIVDINTLKNFDDGSVSILKELASWSKGYDTKTAVIGGSLFSLMALRAIVIFSKRDNMKAFDSREEALKW